MTQPTTRFLVLAGETMLDLLAKMQTHSHPMSQLKYIGKNEGDYTLYDNQELVKATQFIAVFDFAPVYIVELENVQITQIKPDSDTSLRLEPELKITMSA